MKYFINQKCKYSLFVEDDALFGLRWFEILEKEIGNIQNSSKWLMIKLFTGIVFINNDWMQLNTVAFGSGLRVQRTGFGSVAVVYPIQHLVPLSQYLEHTVLNYVNQKSRFVEPKDILMEIYRREKGLDEMVLEPSLVQHTGFYSSLEQKNSTYKNFHKMFKSLTFADDFRKIEFNWK
ncbi:hypothetical protein BpHYR1_041500 [Brachionus plicatilis]|uniref:Uncharacterized protein n=1 Tax=Brachionus plicatilis TaxID=10195 RepID=A0A3M7SQL0_BRAPC|nr:hypothetical protein BpHYR1_041500 [Brachionus plicatilis]